MPAPVLENLRIDLSIVRFNGSLSQKNIYRQDAGPEADAAWEALGVDCSCCLPRPPPRPHITNVLHLWLNSDYYM